MNQQTSIPWRPLETVPDDRKDGRDVLLWTEDGHPQICSWDGVWLDPVGRQVALATHWADVTSPGGVTCQGH